jgi:NAD(P)-dependent dehydrogenase (short-subunit alcohol dehydrogenase family)
VLPIMPTILISGANRGIGLELARQYAEDGWAVLGTARDVAAADELAGLGPQVKVLPLDVVDPCSLEALGQELEGMPIDVLIANAGISGNLKARPEEVALDDFIEVMAVNTFAPLALAARLKPNILAGERKLVTAMSSLMSSIGRNDWGTQYSYRASKTGLNAVWSALALEWAQDGICCTLLRPGLVATRMTGFTGITAQESVTGMKAVIARLTLSDSGRIIGYDGQDVPW